jgi:uncharacterized membrane protein
MFAGLTGAGLSAAAGLNAFIPLVIVALAARFTDFIDLPDNLMWLQSWPTIIISVLALLSELVLDKIPGVDHINDLIQSAVRPLVGGVIFAATSAAAEIDAQTFWSENPLIAGIIGAVIAGLVHMGKSAARPAVNAATGGTGAPVASFAEDATSVGLSFIAIFIPFLVFFVFIGMGVVLYYVLTTGRRRRRNREARIQQDLLEREAAQESSDKPNWWRGRPREKSPPASTTSTADAADAKRADAKHVEATTLNLPHPE